MVLSEMVTWRRNQSVDDGKLLGDDTLMAPEPLCGGMSIEHSVACHVSVEQVPAEVLFIPCRNFS